MTNFKRSLVQPLRTVRALAFIVVFCSFSNAQSPTDGPVDDTDSSAQVDGDSLPSLGRLLALRLAREARDAGRFVEAATNVERYISLSLEELGSNFPGCDVELLQLCNDASHITDPLTRQTYLDNAIELSAKCFKLPPDQQVIQFGRLVHHLYEAGLDKTADAIAFKVYGERIGEHEATKLDVAMSLYRIARQLNVAERDLPLTRCCLRASKLFEAVDPARFLEEQFELIVWGFGVLGSATEVQRNRDVAMEMEERIAVISRTTRAMLGSVDRKTVWLTYYHAELLYQLGEREKPYPLFGQLIEDLLADEVWNDVFYFQVLLTANYHLAALPNRLTDSKENAELLLSLFPRGEQNLWRQELLIYEQLFAIYERLGLWLEAEATALARCKLINRYDATNTDRFAEALKHWSISVVQQREAGLGEAVSRLANDALARNYAQAQFGGGGDDGAVKFNQYIRQLCNDGLPFVAENIVAVLYDQHNSTSDSQKLDAAFGLHKIIRDLRSNDAIVASTRCCLAASELFEEINPAGYIEQQYDLMVWLIDSMGPLNTSGSYAWCAERIKRRLEARGHHSRVVRGKNHTESLYLSHCTAEYLHHINDLEAATEWYKYLVSDVPVAGIWKSELLLNIFLNANQKLSSLAEFRDGSRNRVELLLEEFPRGDSSFWRQELALCEHLSSIYGRSLPAERSEEISLRMLELIGKNTSGDAHQCIEAIVRWASAVALRGGGAGEQVDVSAVVMCIEAAVDMNSDRDLSLLDKMFSDLCNRKSARLAERIASIIYDPSKVSSEKTKFSAASNFYLIARHLNHGGERSPVLVPCCLRAAELLEQTNMSGSWQLRYDLMVWAMGALGPLHLVQADDGLFENLYQRIKTCSSQIQESVDARDVTMVWLDHHEAELLYRLGRIEESYGIYEKLVDGLLEEGVWNRDFEFGVLLNADGRLANKKIRLETAERLLEMFPTGDPSLWRSELRILERLYDHYRSLEMCVDSELVAIRILKLTIVHDSENLDRMAEAYNMWSLALNYQKKHLAAIRANGVAVNLTRIRASQDGINRRSVLFALRNLLAGRAGFFSDLGEVDKAEKVFRDMFVECDEVMLPNIEQTGLYYSNFAYLLLQQKKYEEAVDYFQRAIEVWSQFVNMPVNVAYNGLGIAAYQQGTFDLAVSYFRKACHNNGDPDNGGEIDDYRMWSNYGLALFNLGEDALALEAYKKAAHYESLEMNRTGVRGLEASIITASGTSMALASQFLRNDKSLEAWQEFERGKAAGLRAELNEATKARAGDTMAAELQKLRAEFGALEDLQVGGNGGDTPLVNRLVTGEQERVTGLADGTMGEQQRELRQKLAELQSQLSSMQPNENESYTLEDIQSSLPRDTAILSWLDMKPEDYVSRGLPSSWALVLRSAGAPHWVPLDISKTSWGQISKKADSVHTFNLENRRNTQADAGRDPLSIYEDFGELISSRTGSPSLTDFEEARRIIYNERLAPVEAFFSAIDGLPEVRHVIVIPSVAMADIPLSALTQKYSVSYIPSASIYTWLRLRQQQRRDSVLPATTVTDLDDSDQILIVADPKFGDVQVTLTDSESQESSTAGVSSNFIESNVTTEGSSPSNPDPHTLFEELVAAERGYAQGSLKIPSQVLEELPGTRLEANALASIAQAAGMRTKILLGADASSQQLTKLAGLDQLQEFNFVHIATHAIPEWQSPLKSFLVLSPFSDTNSEPSIAVKQAEVSASVPAVPLTAEQIMYRWNLDARLVTLSACQTQAGASVVGEGRVGFAHALLVAGAESVLLSHWKVDDTATALLMAKLYELLLETPREQRNNHYKARALTSAQQWLASLTDDQVAPLLDTLPILRRGTKTIRQMPLRTSAEPDKTVERPFAHPYFWAAWTITGLTD